MFLLDWYKQWLHIKAEYKGYNINLDRETKELKVCKSCETLKQQLEFANYEKEKLLSRLLDKPQIIPETRPPEVTRPRTIPWAVKRQMLEREDRERANALRNAAASDKEDIKDLEKELDIASETREETRVENS